ncbi:NUDIX hydrolase [Arthrobacter cryoconiti]|uniref:NUDIX domain-containing protein n=1 Tax=Arthrobacter cryoconiti TaxID=748907 RepID=A0ABV8QZD0_9MICC|nr:NUDIX hydrolase [Arthrobacter cryoconiti]MCC9068229.1 NUDIX hydrolase [Arthrobacter cryoconiti]
MDLTLALAPLEDAATVILLQDSPTGPQVLMLERPGRAGSFAGAWVFPGGKVDPEDRESGLDELGAARSAAVREVGEETAQVLAADSLIHISNWTPMRPLPRRFRTWFFLARAASGNVVLSEGEHVAFAWMKPAAVLAKHAAGEMHLLPPTWISLYFLTHASSVAQALSRAQSEMPFDYTTYVLGEELSRVISDSKAMGGGTVVWAGDADYPGVGAGPTGARNRLYMESLPWVFEQVASSENGSKNKL